MYQLQWADLSSHSEVSSAFSSLYMLYLHKQAHLVWVAAQRNWTPPQDIKSDDK